MSPVALIVELRVGRASPRGLRLAPGRRIPPFTVGRRGTWCIDASGVADVAAHLEFDGESLLVACAPDGNALLDGRPVGPAATVVSPPAVLALGEARLLVDRDDRTNDVVPCEAILAAAAETASGTRVMPPQVTRLMPLATTRVMPMETLIAERRSEAAEKAFFDADAASPGIPSRVDRKDGHDAIAREGHGDATEHLSDGSVIELRRRANRLVVGAVLTVPVVIGLAMLSVRAEHRFRAAVTSHEGSTADSAQSNGVGREPATGVAPTAGAAPLAAPAAAETAPAGSPLASDVGSGVVPSGTARAAVQASGSRSPAQHASAERAAVDLVAAGDYAQAARAYDDLASSRAATPAASTFRDAARILRARPLTGVQAR
jgi:hypothetical protein